MLTNLIPPTVARQMADVLLRPSDQRALAETATVLGEQRDAALALHPASTGTFESRGGGRSFDYRYCRRCDEAYPCSTARALGVTDAD